MNILLCLLIFILISCNFSEDGGRWPSKHVRFVYAELKSCVLLICFHNLHTQNYTIQYNTICMIIRSFISFACAPISLKYWSERSACAAFEWWQVKIVNITLQHFSPYPRQKLMGVHTPDSFTTFYDYQQSLIFLN